MIRISKGLDIPIAGEPIQEITQTKVVSQQALVGFDYHGLKPTMLVEVGQTVKIGEPLFSDKTNPGVIITSPTSGTISAIHRGDKRVFQSIVIDKKQHIDKQADSEITFHSYSHAEITQLTPEKITTQLQQSGLWAAFRTRPYSKIPNIDSAPKSIFVNAMDTNPLAATPNIIIKQFQDDFETGLTILSLLAPVNLCHLTDHPVTSQPIDNVICHAFSGLHPAGLSGTHIHFISPVSTKKTVWTINYQDVIAIGKVFKTGKLWCERVISLAGPAIKNPRLITVPLGANLEEITANELHISHNDTRIISGSILGGRQAKNRFAFLGRYHLQISCLYEANSPELFDYLRPTGERYSVLNFFFSKLSKRKLNLTTNTEGEPRNMVPFGNYEHIMPLDILPTQLLRALIIGDTDMAQKLGCLELDEEDLALCSYVCAGKYEYGPILRAVLTKIDREG